MNATGILKRVDEMDNELIPKEIRESLNLNSNDSIEIFIEEDKIILQKYQPGCLFCNNKSNTIIYMGKHICVECLEEMDNT